MPDYEQMSFAGMRVLALESRRATEIAELIRRQQGDAIVAPSMREAPLESNEEAFAFAERLFAGGFDMMIFLTGVGTRALARVLESRYPPGAFEEALRKIAIVARGPKPSAALREMNVPIAVAVTEPNTWRELLVAIDGRPERRIAVQEYGRPSVDLVQALLARGADVTAVPVYQYELPLDTAPLRDAARRIAAGEIDVVMLTTSVQVPNLFSVAEDADLLRAGLRRAVIASVGPSTTETLADFGLQPDVTPTHPKMGFLVKETAEQAAAILARKRS